MERSNLGKSADQEIPNCIVLQGCAAGVLVCNRLSIVAARIKSGRLSAYIFYPVLKGSAFAKKSID
jgi:hypothetical protein